MSRQTSLIRSDPREGVKKNLSEISERGHEGDIVICDSRIEEIGNTARQADSSEADKVSGVRNRFRVH
jgi:hypothetical protein